MDFNLFMMLSARCFSDDVIHYETSEDFAEPVAKRPRIDRVLSQRETMIVRVSKWSGIHLTSIVLVLLVISNRFMLRSLNGF